MTSALSAPSVLEIHLLGPFRILVDGAQVEDRRWSRRKPKSLVKLLALQSHHQLHREQAMELLWPEQEPEAASNSLHKAIHLARRALEPEIVSAARSHFIFTQGHQIILRAPVKLWVDVSAFEEAAITAIRGDDVGECESALAIYGGELLTEDLYEEWAAMRREELRAQYQQVLMKVGRLHKDRGEYQRSIERFKQLLACDSTNEEAHCHLMSLYALTGNRQQAMRQYQQCEQILQKELETEPDADTRELYEQIVSGRIVPLTSSLNIERGSDTGQAINSIAILPFVNASDLPEAEYFSDGITESIINNLSQLERLKVMARSTVFRYKGQEIDPQEVGKRLGVRAVLTGRVLHRQAALNIQTELVDVLDGRQLWGEQYNRNSSDIFPVQEEIAREIASKLQLRLSGEEQQRLAKRHTESAEAYDAYLKGRYFWNKRTGDGLGKSIEYFEQAIEKDPDYAAAYAGLSDCYTILVGRHGLPTQEGLAKAKAAAKKALEIDETLAEAHTSLAHARLHNWDWAEAEKEFRRGIELNPGNAFAHQVYSEYLSAVGRLDEAIVEIRKAQEIDLLSLPINSNVAGAFYYARQYDRAIEQCLKVIEMDPTFYWAHRHLARSYEQKQMFDDAIAQFKKAVELSQENLHVLASLGRAYAVVGRIDDAQDILSRLIDEVERDNASPYDIAIIYAGLGENDEAFEWLERAYQERDGVMTHLKVTPLLDNLRSDPRFVNIVRKVGLTPKVPSSIQQTSPVLPED